MFIWAHRGSSGEYPENTMLSFRKAVEEKSDGLEIDVHLSKDGEVVIIHDESLLRTCGKNRNVSDLTLRELKKIKANKTHENYDAYIPSFEEFCSFLKESRVKANIEIKTGVIYYPNIEEKVCQIIKEFGLEEKIIFSSFNWLSLEICHSLLPSVDCGLLFDNTMALRHLSYLAKKRGFTLLHPSFSSINSEMLEEARKEGLGINSWTINKTEEAELCYKWGIGGIITNYPSRMREFLDSLESSSKA